MNKPIFSKPAGESEHCWNNMRLSTTRDCVCELCGTEYPERDPEDDSYVLGQFMGMQFIEECCGKVIDHVYAEFGEEFAFAFLEEFANNPTAPQFAFLLFRLPEILASARINLDETAKGVTKAQSNLNEILTNT